MSNEDKLYSDALNSLTDHYLETLEMMSSEELKVEHNEVSGNSTDRIAKIKGLVGQRILERKKAIFPKEDSRSSVFSSEDILTKIKSKYGKLQNYFESKINSDASGFEHLTLAYRNRNDEFVDETELEGLLEDLIEVGQITEKDL